MGKATEVVQALYAAFGQGDVPALLNLLAEDVSWDFPGPADYPPFGARRGREGALAFFQALGEAEDIRDFAPERFHEAGRTVVVEGHAALILRKNGAPVAYDWAHVWDVEDGHVTRFRGFVDTGQVADAWRR